MTPWCPPALLACLQASPAACAAPLATPDVSHWWAAWPGRLAAPDGSWGRVPAHSLDLALRSGFAADRLAWAFAGGYQAALRALVPGLPAATLAAFCVTEAGGNRPRDINTTITPQADGRLRVDGAKRWATLGPAGALLLVVGRWSDAADAIDPARDLAPASQPPHPRLRVLQVPVPSAGLQVQAMPTPRFVPELPHAQLQLQGVLLPASALLPGDGYTHYAKPFRTLEDLHVTAAVLALLLREARARHWPPAYAEQLVASLLLLGQLADGWAALRAGAGTGGPGAALDATAAGAAAAEEAALHVALAGALHVSQRLLADAAPLWAQAGDEPAAQRWQRDVALLGVAGTARGLRAERAWQRLQQAADAAAPAGGAASA